MNIGEMIKRARDDSKMTQSQLAKEANIGQGWISQVEAGKHGVSQECLTKFLNVLPSLTIYILIDRFGDYATIEFNEDKTLKLMRFKDNLPKPVNECFKSLYKNFELLEKLFRDKKAIK